MSEQNTGDILENAQDTTVAVARVVSTSPTQLWKYLVTREGAAALLGAGGELGDKGDSWRAGDGSFGVIRSYHPLEQVRFTWHAAETAPKTTVELRIASAGPAGTELSLTHTGIPHYFDAVALTKRWESALDAIVAGASADLVSAS